MINQMLLAIPEAGPWSTGRMLQSPMVCWLVRTSVPQAWSKSKLYSRQDEALSVLLAFCSAVLVHTTAPAYMYMAAED